MTKLIVLFLGISFFSFIAFGNTTSYVNWRDYTGKKAVFINVDAYYEVDNAALRDLRPIDVEKANEYFKYQVVFHLDGESFYVSTQNIGLKNGCAYAHHCIGDEVLFKPLERTGGSFGVQHAVIELIHFTHDHQLRFGVKYIDRETGKNKIEYNIKPAQIFSLVPRDVYYIPWKKGDRSDSHCDGNNDSNKLKRGALSGAAPWPGEPWNLLFEVETAESQEKIFASRIFDLSGCSNEKICANETMISAYYDYQNIRIWGISQFSNSSCFHKTNYLYNKGGLLYLTKNASLGLYSAEKERTTVNGSVLTLVRNVPGFHIGVRDPSGLIWSPVPINMDYPRNPFNVPFPTTYKSLNQAQEYCQSIGGRIPRYEEVQQLAEYIGRKKRNASLYSFHDDKTELIPGLNTLHLHSVSSFITDRRDGGDYMSYSIYAALVYPSVSGGPHRQRSLDNPIICVKEQESKL